jgi:hypothetical protein
LASELRDQASMKPMGIEKSKMKMIRVVMGGEASLRHTINYIPAPYMQMLNRAYLHHKVLNGKY